ncbi:MAG: ankyrin repeat domain-containing protein [Rariglobus sp.]
MRFPLFTIISAWRGFIRFWLVCGLAATAAAQTINVEWFEAARMGDTESLKRQLAAGANINQVDFTKRAALNHALATGRIETARFLVERGADLTQHGDYLMPLNWAMQAGDISLVRLMLDKGANPRAKVETALGTRSDLLDDTVRWGRVDMLRLFESKGYAVPSSLYSASVNWAARFGQVEAMRFYLGKGGSPNELLRDNLALDVAAFYGDMPVVEALLQAGAKPNMVSTGEPPAKDFASFKRTPLMTAVMADEREMVARLLKAGADARAQGDAALVWADLIGDEQIYRMLRTAGAKEPASFAFSDWLGKGYEYKHEETERQRVSAGEATVAELAKLGALRAERTVAEPLPAGTKVAIVLAGDGLADAEALLSVKATALPGAVVLERTEIRRIMAERKLMELLGKPGGEAEAGRLLGADILVILKSHVMEKTKWREARVVAVRTGVVAGTAYAGEKDPVDAWTDEVIGHCGAAGDVLRVGEGKFRLVAVPRVVASLNTMEAREWERRLTLVLAARIGRLPGVLIAEREALDRLTLEQGAAGAAYATSTWIMEAALDVPLGEGGELRLVLSLRNGAGKTEQLVVTAPRSNDTSALTEQAVVKIAAALGAPVEGQWTQTAEAAVFQAKAKRYAGIFLWAEASAAVESAWALGLRTDDVARLRLKTTVARIMNMQRFFLPQKRLRKNYYGLEELVSFRAPLLMPVEDARELPLDEQLDLANRALDIYATSLPGLGATFGGEPGSRWLCGEVWDAATLPLRYTEPLSYGRTHGAELAALRVRLLGLHAEALAMARKRRNAIEVQTLTGIGIKHLSWWQPDEAVFRSAILKTLKDATTWAPPLSEQSAWVNAWRVAAPCMGATTGRAAQAWVRLAREMAVSADNREAFFGLALEAIETPNVRRRVEIMQQLRDRIPALNDADRGINTLVYAIAHEAVPSDPFLEKAMRPWYMEAFAEVRRINGHNSDIRTGWPQDGNYDMTGRNGGTYPEVRAFNVEQVLRRLETIKRSGPGGVMEFSFAEKLGYKAEDVAAAGRLQAEVAPLFQQLASREPQAAYASESMASKVRHIGMVDRTYGMGQSIASGKVRNPFVERYAQLTDTIKTRWSFRMTGYPVPRPHGWYFAKVVAGYAYGVIAPGGVDEVLAFQMDAAGEPKNVRRVLQGFMMNYDGRQDVEPQVSDRWMVIPGEKRRKEDEEVPADKPREVVAVLDMRNPAAAPRYFPLAGSQAALRSLRLAGDRIIYSFVYNPTFSRGGGSQEMEQKGDPAFGIAEIDILTGKETLLASSRRQPAAAPVESEGLKVFRAISLIGDTAFTVAGESKQSKLAFDLVTREWREMTPEDRKLAQADKTALPNEWWIQIDGTWLSLQRMTQENNLRFYGGRGLGFIDIAVNFDYGNLETTHKLWVQAVKDAVKVTGEGYKYIYPMQDGLYVTLANGFYYWLPMETVRARLTEAVVAKRAATQAKAAEEKPKTE